MHARSETASFLAVVWWAGTANAQADFVETCARRQGHPGTKTPDRTRREPKHRMTAGLPVC